MISRGFLTLAKGKGAFGAVCRPAAVVAFEPPFGWQPSNTNTQQVRHGSSTKKLAEKRLNDSLSQQVRKAAEAAAADGVVFDEDNLGGRGETAEELARTLDFTVPEDKLEHVKMLKKKISGGHLSERSLYREVPTPAEMDLIKIPGNFIPNIAPNAREIIDFALSHIPVRDGPRRSRQKKRMAHKWEVKRAQDAKRKAQTIAAREAKHKKLNHHRNNVKKVLAQAAEINAAKATAVAAAAAPVAVASQSA